MQRDLLAGGGTTCFLLGAVILFLGVAILRDGGRERLHRVTALMLFFGGLGAILAGLGLAGRASAPQGTTPFTQVAIHFASTWEFFFPSLLLFTLVFPTDHPWLKRVPLLQELIFVPYVFHLVLTVVADKTNGDFFLPMLAKTFDWAGPFLTPLRVGLGLIYDAHAVLFSLVNLGYVIVTFTILTVRGRKMANPRLRAQTRIMRWGLGICLLLYSLAVPVPTILGKASQLDWLAPPLLVLALATGSGSIAYSIIRHRFLDTRLFLRRSVLFVGTAGVLAILYLAVFRQIERFLATFSGLDVSLLEPLFLMMALVVLQPIVTRVEELADRWMMRERREGRVVLEQLSRDIVTLMDLQTLAERLTHSVFESMAAEGVGFVARPARRPTFELLARSGFPRVTNADWEELTGRLSVLEGLTGPLRLPQVLARANAAEAPDLIRVAERFPVELLVPFSHGGELLGALVLGPKETRTRYTREDLDLLELLGNQTAAAVRNSHLLAESLERAALEEELHLARQIQFSYLPSAFPSLERVQLSGTNVPSKQVGGDYYDYIELADSLLLVVADVVGKGVPAALLMSMLQASLRTLAAERRPLSEILGHLNHLIRKSGIEGKFATCFLARLDIDTLRLSYSNAGHNPPCLVGADGRVRWLKEGGFLLGVFEDPGAVEASVHLEPGDRLVLYTDGITEAANGLGEFFGEEGLLSTLTSLPEDLDAEQVVRAVMGSVRSFCDGIEPEDDMTVVALRVPQLAAVPA